MSIRSTFGMDGFDLAVHLLVTFFAFLALGPGMELAPFIALGVVPIVSLLVLAWRRRRGLATLPPGTTSELDAPRAYELETRLAELELLQERFLELEERVDFAERLLARAGEAEKLVKGS